MATKITRVFDLLQYNKEQFPKEDFVAGKYDGQWKKFGTEQFIGLVDDLSRGLISLGIVKEDKVAIMSHNRPEWNICDFGIMQIGAHQVPMYPTLAEHDIRFILGDAEVKIAFVGDAEIYKKLDEIKKEVRPDLKLYVLDDSVGLPHWTEVVELGKAHADIDLEPYRSIITPEDILTLIYTSGTTGTPKGVMLTHDNLVSNFTSASVILPATVKRGLSFLPLSHIFERMIIYLYFRNGVAVYYAQSMDTIVADMGDVKPDGFSTVPRLLEKVYDKIMSKGQELTGLKKAIFYWAVDLGLKYEFDGKNGWWYETQLSLARKLVFKKWQAALGGNIEAVVSGGAALQPRLARIFWAAGIPVLEGYGLTETSPVICVNFFGKGNAMFGTVGPAMEGVEVKIAEDGEILCRGRNVMKGYYKRPDLTQTEIDAEGWFHTGDIGELVNNRFLRITDRKKEMFKTAGGKYVAPQVLENKYNESPLIEQIMVLGENRKFPSALIVPAFPALKEWCAHKGIPYTTNEDMVGNALVIDKYQRILDQFNVGFGKWEQVKRFVLLAKPWSIETGEFTPKLSLKRKVILKNNEALIEKIYVDAEKDKDHISHQG